MASNRHSSTLHGEDTDTVDALVADAAARAGGPSGAAEFLRKNSKMGISQEYAPAVTNAVALMRKGSMKAAAAVVDDGLSKKQREDMERQKRLREGALKFRAHALGYGKMMPCTGLILQLLNVLGVQCLNSRDDAHGATQTGRRSVSAKKIGGCCTIRSSWSNIQRPYAI
jgi:hypothetical protein